MSITCKYNELDGSHNISRSLFVRTPDDPAHATKKKNVYQGASWVIRLGACSALGGENARSTGRVVTLQASKPLAERLTAAIWAAAFVGRTDDV